MNTSLVWTPFGSLKVIWPPNLPHDRRLDLSEMLTHILGQRDLPELRQEHWFRCRACQHLHTMTQDQDRLRCPICDSPAGQVFIGEVFVRSGIAAALQSI